MEIVFEAVTAVSSEDQAHPATNLINHTTKREWLTSQSLESTAYVEFKLQEATKIASIDIGNFGSAFVTVEVGSSTSPNEWFAFLPSTKFMDAIDARNGIGVKKVLLFIYDQFHTINRDKVWDQLRVTCQQMFIKARKYGLSFIVCRKEIPASRLVNKQVVMKQKEKDMIKKLTKEKISDFGSKTKPEFDVTDFIDESLYSPKPTKKIVAIDKTHNQSLKHGLSNFSSTASSTAVTSKSPSSKPSSSKTSNRKLSEITTKTQPAKSQPSKSQPAKSQPAKSQPKRSRTQLPSNTEYKTILSGVIFTISGYINPERSRIRDTGLAMGAKFTRDITTSTTHLVCAFVNTPKYNEFLGRGKIMKKEWIYLQSETKRVCTVLYDCILAN